MEKDLLQSIENIKNNKDLLNYDESATKNTVVLRILSILGWNIYDRDEVFPEYNVENRRVDYSLRYSEENKVFIEVKKPREDLESHQKQILDYSFQEGVKIAILTNGITWWFYLPLWGRSWEQRKFYTIEIFDQNSDEIKQRFIDFLLKENVISGEAVGKAEIIKKGKETDEKIKETLPKAWNKLISEKDKNLINLLKDETEKICGFETSIEKVENFIENNKEQLTINVEIFSKLEKHAIRSSNTVQRLTREVKRGQVTTQVRYFIPILESLIEEQGECSVKKIYDKVEQKMKDILVQEDYEGLNSGDIRWRNSIRFARQSLVVRGFLDKNSPHGIWKITDKGRGYYNQNKEK